MKNILILTIVAIILLIAVVIICFRFQKGDSGLLNSKNKNIDTQKKCNSCRQPIHASATVCQHCGQRQGLLGKYFGDIAIIVSIVMVILATAQFLGARKKNIDASKALYTAKVAADDTKKVRTEVNIARDEINFNLLLTRATNDGRFALDELHKIAMTEGHRFQETAQQTVYQIIVDLQIIVTYRDILDLKKKYHLDPAEASFDDFYKVFEQGPLYDKIDVLTTVWHQKRFPKAKRFEMLYKVITTTESIKILSSACELMDKEAKLGKDFVLDHAQYAKWWEENREEYNKNPEDQPIDSND